MRILGTPRLLYVKTRKLGHEIMFEYNAIAYNLVVIPLRLFVTFYPLGKIRRVIIEDFTGKRYKESPLPVAIKHLIHPVPRNLKEYSEIPHLNLGTALKDIHDKEKAKTLYFREYDLVEMINNYSDEENV